jgi:hypothetical protein
MVIRPEAAGRRAAGAAQLLRIVGAATAKAVVARNCRRENCFEADDVFMVRL